ncbi:MAG: hypothetical protein CR972_00655 [Candidatus Moraniibacteriota bacterium]|nr:MAG: hypothetical protein CR972_00655 [Candidatus Moranbacteria bacterium]
MDEGNVVQITLPNGKYMYVGISTYYEFYAKKIGLKCVKVRYSGDCSYYNINERVHEGRAITINGVCASTMLDKIATYKECINFCAQ